MRRLITDTEDRERQLIDGVRIMEPDSSVLMTPDRFEASFTLQVESLSKAETEALINEYANVIQEAQSD